MRKPLSTASFLLMIVLANTVVHAQMRSSIGNNRLARHSFKMKSPGSNRGQSVDFLRRSDVLLTLMVGFSAYGLHRWDSEIDEDYALETEGLANKMLKKYGKLGGLYDSQKVQGLLAASVAGILLHARLNHETEAAKTVTLMLKALAVSTVITTSLKLLIGRHRPYTGYGPYEFETLDFQLSSDVWSFPSGHTSSIFALSTVLAKRSSSHWVKIPVYTLAGSVGFQRMLNRKHWASDVLAGGLIGYLVGKRMVSGAVPKNGKLQISPWSDGQKAGVQFSF